jgi:O-antigen biosynthesis protein
MTRRAYRIVREEGVRGITQRLEYRRLRREARRNYRCWVDRYDTLNEVDREAILGRVGKMAYTPLISILMPVYDVEERWLRCAIQSVLDQCYPHWELCVADDHSPRPQVRAVLEEFASRDRRVKVTYRRENGHISMATNSALELATGEFVAFLDNDDQLAEHALYLVAEELNAHPEADLVYSDEDKMDEEGERYFPNFKPDWNPDLLCSTNFLCHLVLCRTALVRRLGGLRVGYEGAQDYDLLLRLVEQIPESHIRHIPRVLYHWRSMPGSTAHATSEKSYAHEAGRRALASHFQRQGISATVVDAAWCSYRAVYPIHQGSRVSLILDVGDTAQIDGALELTRHTRFDAIEILIVKSRRDRRFESMDALEDQEPWQVRWIQVPADVSPSARLNVAARHASGDILGFLGPVKPLGPDWLTEMVSHAVRPEIGAVGAKLYGPSGTIHEAGVILGVAGLVGRAYHNVRSDIEMLGRMIERAGVIQNCSAVTRNCLLLRRAVWDQMGGFDEVNLPSLLEDVDLCLRIRKQGYRILWTPFAELRCGDPDRADEGASEDEHWDVAEQTAYFHRKWARELRQDPCYNPNLTLEQENLSLATPPRSPTPWPAPGAMARGRRPVRSGHS